MVLTCVHIWVKKEKINDFIAATVLNHTESRKEPGNLRFDVLQDEKNPQKFMLYEVFESEDAAAAHKATKHYQVWRDTVQDWMEQPRQGVRYNVIKPENKEQW